MRIITESRLTSFWRKHPDSEQWLRNWRAVMRLRRYHDPHEVRNDFSAADFLGAGKTVFDVSGNKYRLVVTIRYDLGRVYIRHVVTHREYDRLTRDGEL